MFSSSSLQVQRSSYASLADMEKDLQLIFTNARTFNEPGSQIYRDAGLLSKLVKNKTAECLVSLQAKQNRGSKSSRRVSKMSHSTAIANLQYEDSESEEEDSESEETLETQDDPFWKLFNHVRTFTTERGLEIAEAFLTLPSKRELPDYYQQIEKPICLTSIRKKIRQAAYPTLEALGEDFDLMFNNCKTYNRQESKLWKDGAKLQKVTQTRLAELLEGDLDASAMEAMETVRKSPKDPKEQVRKKLRLLFNSIYYWANSDGIQPIGVFLEKPSRKDYPDYYDIISEPIDMNMIDARIKGGQYRSEEELLADCKLMFSNCRLYNEEGSPIYEDANILEKVLLAKAREMGVFGQVRLGFLNLIVGYLPCSQMLEEHASFVLPRPRSLLNFAPNFILTLASAGGWWKDQGQEGDQPRPEDQDPLRDSEGLQGRQGAPALAHIPQAALQARVPGLLRHHQEANRPGEDLQQDQERPLRNPRGRCGGLHPGLR